MLDNVGKRNKNLMRHDNDYNFQSPEPESRTRASSIRDKQARCGTRKRRVKCLATGFTLLELLIVIAIIAIISAFLIFILNPAETLRKGRDSQRISDLSTINRAIALYITTSFNPDLDGNNSRGDCGTHVFVGRGNSPDITATSTAEKILSQPDGDSTTSTVDGTGWIPVNFASISGGSPISRLPLDPSYRVADPANITDNDLLYLYGCDTDLTWELNANLESNQFSNGGDDDRESTDGGNNNNIHEVGTKLTILGTSGMGEDGGGDYKAFITSAIYTADLVTAAQSPPINSSCADGLSCADAICQYHADNAGLGSVAWKAWISSAGAGNSATNRLLHPTGPIYLVDSVTKIADDWTDLISADPDYLDNPINKDETGGTTGDLVWTHTKVDGTWDNSNIDYCLDWTSDVVIDDALVGIPSATNSWWTRFSSDVCGALNRLYCFSQAPL